MRHETDILIDSQKSTTQKMGDSARGGADSAQKAGEKSYVQQAGDMLGNAAQNVADTLKGTDSSSKFNSLSHVKQGRKLTSLPSQKMNVSEQQSLMI